MLLVGEIRSGNDLSLTARSDISRLVETKAWIDPVLLFSDESGDELGWGSVEDLLSGGSVGVGSGAEWFVDALDAVSGGIAPKSHSVNHMEPKRRLLVGYPLHTRNPRL